MPSTRPMRINHQSRVDKAASGLISTAASAASSATQQPERPAPAIELAHAARARALWLPEPAPPSTAASTAPTAPMPRPPTISILTPASCERAQHARVVRAVRACSGRTSAVRRSGSRRRHRSAAAASLKAHGTRHKANGNRRLVSLLCIRLSATSSWMVTSLMISKRRVPLGVVTTTLVALFLVQNRAADGRRGGDEALLCVRVLRHDELVDESRCRLPATSRSSRSRPCREESGRGSSARSHSCAA